MRTPLKRGHSLAAKVAFVVTVIVALLMQSQSASDAAGGHEQIKGSGSSWAYNAVNQWISDVQSQGMQVVFTPSGSAQGRRDFANGVTDFAVSDIGYQGKNPVDGTDDVSARPYAYLPVVGGGTAFPYHIVVHGQLVKNLRLSQLTLAKIFCDQIINWNDPEITADNNGIQLPSIPIVPVVHSEGAGTTYQVTDWLSHLFPSMWQQFSGYNFPVEYWPSGKGSQISQNGSDNVIATITSSAGQGTIGFDEYSYALQAGYPVVNVENNAGYFVAPDQYNVAVALTQAQINMDASSPDYLLENLQNVWVFNDPRAYPLPSYSYFVEPTSAKDPTMDTAKRQTIADYLSYSLCQGQGETGPIGYSPLPVNLVQASFQQLGKLHDADPNVSLQNVQVQDCNNPTFDPSNLNVNRLAEIAPQPPLCDKAGQGPCNAGVDIVIKNPGQNGSVPPPVISNTRGSGSAAGGTSGGQTATESTTTGSGGGGGSSAGGFGTVGSSSGALATSSASASGASVSGSAPIGGPAGSGASSGGSSEGLPPRLVITTLAADHIGSRGYGLVAAVLLLMLVAAPPVINRLVRRRRGRAT